MLFVFCTSCVGYDEDIDEIWKKYEELKTAIENLQKQVDEGNYIVSYQTISGGFKITFKDGRSFDIVNGQNGTNGKDGTTWDIGKVNNCWYKDGKNTGYLAVAKDGTSSPSPQIWKNSDDAYYWIVFNWEEDQNDFAPDTLWNEQMYGYNTFIVSKDAYYYELNVWDMDLSQYVKVQLPKVPNLNPGQETPVLQFLGYYNIFDKKRDISLDDIYNDLPVTFWWIDRIRDGDTGANIDFWEGKETLEIGNVLITSKRDSVAAIVRTSLTGNAWSLTLRNSLDGELPIVFEDPVKHEGMLTRATADPIYIIPFKGIDGYYSSKNEFLEKFKSKAVYSLVDNNTGAKSEYSASITLTDGAGTTITTGMVSRLVGESNNISPSGGSYEVPLGEEIKVEFDTNGKDYIYDYYVEADNKNEAETDFGLTIDKSNGSFMIEKADATDFILNVYKLHYNGNVYKQQITIKPKT